MASIHDNENEGPQVANWDRHLQVYPGNERPRMSERLSSSGLETLSSPSYDQTLFEGMRSPGLDSIAGYEKPIDFHDGTTLGSTAMPKERRYCGLPVKWLIAIMVAVFCILVALSVSLGVTLSRKGSG